jgi:hypothetical protein
VPDIPEGAVIELALGGLAEFRRQDVNVERLKSAVQARFAPLTVRIRNALVPPGIIHTTNRERLSRSELERQIVEQLVHQHAEYRETAPEWGRLILDVKNMAVEGDLPANIVDHVREALDRKLTVSPNGAPDGAPEHVLGASPHPLTPSPTLGEGE